MPSVALTPAQVSTVEAAIKRHLVDPESARFDGINAVQHPNGYMFVCGRVNSRNRMGGYAGASPFSGTLAGQNFTIGEVASNSELHHAYVAGACRSKGLFI